MTIRCEIVPIVRVVLAPGCGHAETDALITEGLLPVVAALQAASFFSCALLLGGELLSELSRHHPALLDDVRNLVDRGQVELMGTARYGAVLSSIPERDAIAHLSLHASALRQAFGERPSGAEVPWGVWEPTFPRLYAAAGLGWALVPAGLLATSEEPEPHGVYRTEREGDCLALLPSDSWLLENRGRVPVEAVLAHLERRAAAGHGLVPLLLDLSPGGAG